MQGLCHSVISSLFFGIVGFMQVEMVRFRRKIVEYPTGWGVSLRSDAQANAGQQGKIPMLRNSSPIMAKS
jgi:hypothetical protein